ncbi:hypothetical protein PoB_005500300 [Plakobranchus ocellatus]|uniref:Uncharacterized protein n=1 Tax=Plakobranchus ocellatus TaxID=259542 RepID=A0AAV4CBZ1_9GAST|nr:hypothetical protein PoB_005500300 [Plakobranchus ocellatus]
MQHRRCWVWTCVDGWRGDMQILESVLTKNDTFYQAGTVTRYCDLAKAVCQGTLGESRRLKERQAGKNGLTCQIGLRTIICKDVIRCTRSGQVEQTRGQFVRVATQALQWTIRAYDKARQDKATQDKARHYDTRHIKTRQGKAKQDDTRHARRGKAKQSNMIQDIAKRRQGKMIQDIATQSKAKQDDTRMSRQGKARQSKVMQDISRQGKAR